MKLAIYAADKGIYLMNQADDRKQGNSSYLSLPKVIVLKHEFSFLEHIKNVQRKPHKDSVYEL
jgi:hypothetical protein